MSYVSLDKIIRETAVVGQPVRLPAGHYELRSPAIPFFREATGEATKVLTSGIIGAGPDQTFIHVIGDHDGLNLNNVADVVFADFQLLCEGQVHGGINYFSLTNGTRDVAIHNVWMGDLPRTLPTSDDPNYIADRYQGGKAITIQPGKANSRNVRVSRCKVRNCPIAFGVDCRKDGDASLIVLDSEVYGCDAALSLSCSGNTTNQRMNCYVDGLRVYDTCRLMLNGRYSNTRLNNVTVSGLRAVIENPFWEESPFRKNFGENRLVCKPGTDVWLDHVNVYSDSEWLTALGFANASGLWIRDQLGSR